MLNTIKLFCIPFSGGNAYSYSEFKKYLSGNIKLINLELPGRGKRINEPLLTNIDLMTEDLFCQIKNEVSGRYAIFGHSLGALLAFTLCKYITIKGANPPLILFLSGQTAASLIEADDRSCLPDDEFINMLKEMKGTPEELLEDNSFIKFFLPIIRADFQSIATYRYTPVNLPLTVPITVLLGSEEEVNNEDAARWQQETDRTISIHRFKGAHFFIFNQTEEICRLISEKVNQFI